MIWMVRLRGAFEDIEEIEEITNYWKEWKRTLNDVA